MTTYTLYQGLFDEQLGQTDERIKIFVEYGEDFNGDGLNDIKVTLKIDSDSNSGSEDMIGVAFDIGNDSLINSLGLTIDNLTTYPDTDPASTTFSFQDNPVAGTDYILGQNAVTGSVLGINIQGGGVESSYDAAVKFNQGGAGDGIVQEASFLISGTQNLDAYLSEILNGTNWYVRLQSTDGGEGSAKTAGFILDINQPPSEPPAAPAVDVEKYVSIDGGLTWEDADMVTGPLFKEGLGDPIFKFVVSNTGNVELSNLSLSDSAFDLNGVAEGTAINIASLAAGATYETTFTAPWQEGQHTNIATVFTTYTDNAGNTSSVSDSDDANYFGDALPEFTVTKTASVSTIREDLGGDVTYSVTIHNTDSLASGDLDPITITSLPDTIWLDNDADGMQDAGELQTVDRMSDALAQWQAAGNTGDIVLNPGEAFTFNYTVSFAGGNVLKPWADVVNTIVVDAVDDEGNTDSQRDDAVVDVVQKNQRSIEIDSLTGTRNGAVVVGNFQISNASGDPVDVLVDALNMVFQEQTLGGKGSKLTWTLTGENYTTQFWLDSNNNRVFDLGETSLGTSSKGEFVETAIVFGSSVYVGYQSTFLDDSVPDPLKATAGATIDGRFDKLGNQVEFHYSTTF